MTSAPSPDEQALHYFESLESMEGLVATQPSTQPARFAWLPGAALLRMLYPGVLAAGTIGLAATWLSQAYQAPVMLFALLIGMAFHFLHEEGRCRVGIEFSSRTILRLGVALLGLRITTSQIAELGVAPILMVCAGVATTCLCGWLLGQRLGLGRYFGLLSGGAVAICGASAALAISTSLPPYANKERDTVLTVVVVTSLSTVAMVLYPMLVPALHLTHVEAGLFLGGTIHDVAQVVGAGYMVSPETGEISTYVKLLRVAALIPVVACLSWLALDRATPGAGLARTFPVFLLGFAALLALNSALPLPKFLTDGASSVSSWCLVTAISALGMKTSFRQVFAAGWRPLGLIVTETVWIAALVLGAILLLRH